jgi:hypothetical protein
MEGCDRVRTTIRFGDGEQALRRRVEAAAKQAGRSVGEQLKYYALVALMAADNPDLPVALIEDCMAAQAESTAGLGEPYRWTERP